MTTWQIMGLIGSGLISGGILTTLGGVVTTVMTNRNAAAQAKRQREDAISDRNFNAKKDIYADTLKRFNQIGIARQGGKDYPEVTMEQVAQFGDSLSLFNLYCSKTVKEKMNNFLKLLSFSISKPDSEEHMRHVKELKQAVVELEHEMKKDLGIQ